jgi:UDP-GlcNAc:undecaprenyl-phosphate GlcNAc-1-phosphate transferase
MGAYLVVLLVGAATTFLVTPVVRRIAIRFGVISHPADDRHVHTEPVPLLGGVAMFVGFLAAIVVATQLSQFRPMFEDSSEMLGVVIAAGAMFFVGMVDDIRDVSPPAKMAGQVLSASLLAMFGVTMFFFRVPFHLFGVDLYVPGPDEAALITVLWVVLMANAINLIDGLDGLAAGIVAIAGTALYLFADRLSDSGFLEPSNIGPLIAVIAVGICVGFLPWNFNPARIFMGDAGALFLGLLLAVPTITVGGRTDVAFTGNTYFFFAPLLIPVVILGVPLLDTAFSFVRRLVKRQSWHTADAGHLHHRLMHLGHGPRRAVVILWAWTAVLSGAALLPVYTDQGNALVPFAIAALALLLYAFFHPGVRETRGRAFRERHPSAAGLPDDDPAVVDLDAERRRRA